MKNLIVIVFICFCISFARQLKIEKNASLRDSSHFRTSQVTTYLRPGEVFEIIDTYADWYYVEIIDGSIHKGKKGWIWQGRLDIDGKDAGITQKGVTLREGPDGKSKAMNYIINGAWVRIIKSKVTWYKISGGKHS